MEIEIEGIRPIGRNLWSAAISLNLGEVVEDCDVAQVCDMRLRFRGTEDETALELMRKVHAEAERFLSVALAELRKKPVEAVLEALFQEQDHWKVHSSETAP